MSRPVLLDLFSGAGGAAQGYHDAGFDVIGVDINPQPRYPFRFIQGDALDVLAGWDLLPPFDAIHASPPCQAYSRARVLNRSRHPQLVEPTRRALLKCGVPWVIENVEGAPLVDPITLCGTEFGLRVACRDGVKRELRRHRLFESPVSLFGAGGCNHQHPAISVFGDGGPRANPRPDSRAAYEGPIAERRAVMGIDWMDRNAMSQAIPPAYTRFIGEQLLAHLAADPRPGPGPKPGGPTHPQPSRPPNPQPPPPNPVPARSSTLVPACSAASAKAASSNPVAGTGGPDPYGVSGSGPPLKTPAAVVGERHGSG